MILAVDIGNTNIKLGGWDNDNLVFVARIHTNTRETSDEYAIKIMDVLRLESYNNTQFDGAIISSVVPQISGTMADAIRKVFQTERVLLVSPGLKTGLNIKIDDPATLGADLVCAGVSAVHTYTMPCIIISLGTATALFAINENAEYLGGAVAPGVRVAMDALSRGTAQLPHINFREAGPLIGKNTVDSMRSGAIYGFASMIDGMVEKMREELGGNCTVVATGGMANYIIPHCKEEIIISENLVLMGLHQIYHKNI